MKYRKKPVVIEAVRYLGNGKTEDSEVPDWLWAAFEDGTCRATDGGDPFEITTLKGIEVCAPGDYIIQRVRGELCACKPGTFEATYEPVV